MHTCMQYKKVGTGQAKVCPTSSTSPVVQSVSLQEEEVKESSISTEETQLIASVQTPVDDSPIFSIPRAEVTYQKV